MSQFLILDADISKLTTTTNIVEVNEDASVI